MNATLDAPLTLDPQQAITLKLRQTMVDHTERVVILYFDLIDGGGNVVAQRRLTADGAQVQAWITAQETTIYQRLLSKLGVTGTIA